MRIRLLVAGSLALGLLVAAPAQDVMAGSTAVAAKKKKCKRALWKCAPKRYHLSPLSGMEGRGKVGKALSGFGEYNTLHSGRHSYSWKLTPKK